MSAEKHHKKTETSTKRKVVPAKVRSAGPVKLPDEHTQWFKRVVTDREWLTAHVRVMYLRERTVLGQGERLYQAVVFDDRISEAEWQAARTELMRREGALIRIQGSDPERYAVSVMTKFANLRTRKFGFGTMAKDMNLLTLAAALDVVDPKTGEGARAASEEFFGWMLGAFGVKFREIDHWLEEARERAARRQLPWSLSTGPITRRRVMSAFQVYRDHNTEGRIRYGKHDYMHLADLLWEHYETLGCLDRAGQLLDKLSPHEFARYRNRYDQIIAAIRAGPMYGK